MHRTTIESDKAPQKGGKSRSKSEERTHYAKFSARLKSPAHYHPPHYQYRPAAPRQSRLEPLQTTVPASHILQTSTRHEACATPPSTASWMPPPTRQTRWSFHVSYARILDSKRKFLDAALRYYEFSQSKPDEVDPGDLLELLSKAVTCAILAWCRSVHLVPATLLYKHNVSRRLERELALLSRVMQDRTQRTHGFIFLKEQAPPAETDPPTLSLVRSNARDESFRHGGSECAGCYAMVCILPGYLLLSIPTQIGDEGHVVEIDETSLKSQNCWLFGGVDRTTNRRFGVVTFGDRTKPTLSGLVKKYIKAGFPPMCRWTLANNRYLEGMDYEHMWVNHSENYVDQETGAHTNRIEGAWEIRVKQHVKIPYVYVTYAMRGMKQALLPTYLDEYLWRSWFTPPQATPTEVLHALVTGIVKYYY
ncbi:COP9 signalosome complex subunit 4 [Phytophthora citrophthora]|uniref:COP9 signalosome complex subunit 4 n=1 Tax=Phytophthora citrophthora TaxID=4793 RepID=A0AAD9LCV6_9STRA|nr:COP9 signalosome complex subunit 4 [Phytophthora citrophthora]